MINITCEVTYLIEGIKRVNTRTYGIMDRDTADEFLAALDNIKGLDRPEWSEEDMSVLENYSNETYLRMSFVEEENRV